MQDPRLLYLCMLVTHYWTHLWGLRTQIFAQYLRPAKVRAAKGTVLSSNIMVSVYCTGLQYTIVPLCSPHYSVLYFITLHCTSVFSKALNYSLLYFTLYCSVLQTVVFSTAFLYAAVFSNALNHSLLQFYLHCSVLQTVVFSI